ncbi:MAG: Amuc_1099 family pilus-like system protein, partial [Akkermansiaceae bacterium]
KDPNGGREGTIWLIEDLAENKKGKIYRIDRRANPGIVDSTATFTLNALGQDGSKFTIPEGTRFSLPYDEKAKVKPYLLKQI